jgi:hypothetical protein
VEQSGFELYPYFAFSSQNCPPKFGEEFARRLKQQCCREHHRRAFALIENSGDGCARWRLIKLAGLNSKRICHEPFSAVGTTNRPPTGPNFGYPPTETGDARIARSNAQERM